MIMTKFYGSHTIEEIHEMFEKSDDVEQIYIIKKSGECKPYEYRQIAYFAKPSQYSHPFPYPFQYPYSYSPQNEEKYNVIEIQALKNNLGLESILNIFVMDIEDKPDYIMVCDLCEKYCSMDNVDNLILHDFSGLSDEAMTLFLGNTIGNGKPYDNCNYNRQMLIHLIHQDKYLLANIKDGPYKQYDVKFVPSDPKETRFNVHIYGYFTDKEGIKKIKEKLNV